MRLKHSHARTECIIKTVSSGFNPKHHQYDGQIEEEDEVRYFFKGKGDCENGSCRSDSPGCGCVESLAPHHNSADFTSIEVRHCGDVALIRGGLVVESLQKIIIFTELRHFRSLAGILPNDQPRSLKQYFEPA